MPNICATLHPPTVLTKSAPTVPNPRMEDALEKRPHPTNIQRPKKLIFWLPFVFARNKWTIFTFGTFSGYIVIFGRFINLDRSWPYHLKLEIYPHARVKAESRSAPVKGLLTSTDAELDVVCDRIVFKLSSLTPFLFSEFVLLLSIERTATVISN